jgi:hypothetical protein
MKPTKHMPLFIVTGASCVGKSTMCEVLFQNEADYIVMESDLLWHDVYNHPEGNYRTYRELWLQVCANISQIGKPVVLCGCTTPDQFDNCEARSLFSEIHYLAVVCDDDALDRRMRKGRQIADEGWIKSSIDFNNWLIRNADYTNPQIKLLDTTNLTAAQAAKIANEWIMDCMGKDTGNQAPCAPSTMTR